MKKIFYGITVLALLLTMTGCVKYNATMDIKKDKSMNFEIIYAFDANFFGEQQLLKDHERENLENKGFKIVNYESGTFKGFTLSKEIKNIDEVSSKSDVKYTLSDVFESSKIDEKYFKVESGLLKNKYVAKFNFDSSDSSLNDTNSSESEDATNDIEDVESDLEQDEYESTEEENNSDLVEDESDSNFEETEDDETDDFDFNNMSEMDLSFVVKLPYQAINNNATNIKEDGKLLEWELSSTSVTPIEFTFELYNMTTIYCIIGGTSLIVVILLVIIILGIRKNRVNKQKNNTVQTENLEANIEQVQTQPVTPVASVQNVEPVQPQVVAPVAPVQKVEQVQPQVVAPVASVRNVQLVNNNQNSNEQNMN